MIKTIEEEILKTNVDDKKLFLNHLRNFITDSNCIDLNINNRQVIDLELKNSIIFGKNLLIENLEESGFKKYNPQAIYLNKELKPLQNLQHKVSPSRPDTIIDYKSDKEIIIIDAKYYKIGNLPGEYDINKQLRYAEYCAKQKLIKKMKREQFIIFLYFLML